MEKVSTISGREGFIEHAKEWRDKHGGIILKQLRKLGLFLRLETHGSYPRPRLLQSGARSFCPFIQQRLCLPWKTDGQLVPGQPDGPFR